MTSAERQDRGTRGGRTNPQATVSDARWAGRAALAFGISAGVLTLTWYVVGTYTSSVETLRDGVSSADLAMFSVVDAVGLAAIAVAAATLVGALTWYLLVERLDRWSVRHRGAISGAVTGWLAVPVAAACLRITVATPGQSWLLLAASGFAIGLLAGSVLVGWATIPVGALVGYELGRWRGVDRPLAVLVRDRF